MWEAEPPRLPLLLLAAEFLEPLLTAQVRKLEQLCVSARLARASHIWEAPSSVPSSPPLPANFFFFFKLLAFSVNGGGIGKGIAVWVCELL